MDAPACNQDARTEAQRALRRAIACEETGDVPGALRWARAANEHGQSPGEMPLPGAALCLGNALLASDQLEAARQAFERAVALDPNDCDSLFRLAQQLLDSDPRRAEQLLLEVTRRAPGAPEAYLFLGHAQSASGHFERACRAFERAAVLLAADAQAAERAEVQKHLGNAHMHLGRTEAAVQAYHAATELAPETAALWNNLAASLRAADRPQEALVAAQRALTLEPDRHRTLANVGNLFLEVGQPREARRLFERALEVATACDPQAALDHRLELAAAMLQCQDLDATERHARTVLFARPTSARAFELLASVATLRGNVEQSLALYESALTHDPGRVAPYYRLAREGHLRDPEPLRSRLPRTTDPEQRALLHFALGHCYARRGDHALGFEHFTAANRAKPIHFDPAQHRAWVSSVAANFTAREIQRAQLRAAAGPRPLFIVGMIRSGTSLVEQILASHSRVHGGGERPTLARQVLELGARAQASRPYPQCLPDLTRATLEGLRNEYLDQAPYPRDAAAPRFCTDKTPTHFLHLGLIAALFPNAVIVHTRRDPRDVCLSAYSLNFNGSSCPYAYDLEHLIEYHRDYTRLMDHWREHLPLPILEVPYEGLVSDPGHWTRALLEHCELPFEDSCLRFFETPRDVFTASTSQVREPAHTRSIGSWKRFEPYVGDLSTRLLR